MSKDLGESTRKETYAEQSAVRTPSTTAARKSMMVLRESGDCSKSKLVRAYGATAHRLVYIPEDSTVKITHLYLHSHDILRLTALVAHGEL